MDYRDVTILYVKDDQSWCDYVLRYFRNDKLQMRLETLAVDTLMYENPPELEAAIRESHVLVFLTTTNFLNYMEESREWLASMMRKGDQEVSISMFALLDLTPEDMETFCEDYEFPYDPSKCTEIRVDGSNISAVIVHIIELVEKYAEKRASRELRAKRDSSKRRPSNLSQALDIVPSRLPQPGEQVALLFHSEVNGKVTVNFNHVKEDIQCRMVNPYSAVFTVPDVPGKTVTLRVNVDGVRCSRQKLEKANTCEFQSLDFLCQAYGAASKEELDKTLATTFSRSLCSDPGAIKIFEDVMEKAGSTGQNNSSYPTMLHWAAANGMSELSSALLSAPGASVACETNNIEGHDPTDLARKNGYPELAELLDEFIDAQECADCCDLYVKFCGENEGELYETMDNPGVFNAMPYSSMGPLKRPARGGSLDSAMPSLPEGPPPVVPPRPTARGIPPSTSAPGNLPTPKEFLNMKCPTIPTAKGAVGSRSQTELVEIQEEVKKGNFNLHEAEMLFKSWKERHGTGAAVSFKERQQALMEFKNENTKTMQILRNIKKGKKGEMGDVAKGLAPMALNISEPILQRQTLGSGKRRGGSNIGSNASTNSNVSCDSGRDSTVSTLSHQSSSSDDIEYSQPLEPVNVLEGSASYLRRDSDTPKPEGSIKKMNRVSYSEHYLELTAEPSQQEQKPSPPPPPIPARTRSMTTKSIKAKPIATKPKTTAKPTIATSPATKPTVIPCDIPPEPSPTSCTTKNRVYSRKGSSNAPIVAPKPRSK